MSQIFNPRRRYFLKVTTGTVALAGLGTLGYWQYKDRTWVESEPYTRTGSDDAGTCVVVYSRSGNTLLAAKELARLNDADLFVIEASAYPQTFSGQRKASSDASDELREAEVNYPPIDFSQYQSVVLCSPTWWFRPAVPMWAFASAQDFGERNVSLVMTGNTRFHTDKVDEFIGLIESKNGNFTQHHFIKRGRLFWQISDEELRQQIKSI